MDSSPGTMAPPHIPWLAPDPAVPNLSPDADVKEGSMDIIVGGVVTAVLLMLLVLAAVLLQYMYRHKGSYHTNEAKGMEFIETANVSLRGDPTLQGAVDDSKLEYFI